MSGTEGLATDLTLSLRIELFLMIREHPRKAANPSGNPMIRSRIASFHRKLNTMLQHQRLRSIMTMIIELCLVHFDRVRPRTVGRLKSQVDDPAHGEANHTKDLPQGWPFKRPTGGSHPCS